MILAECSICQELLGASANEHISALFCGHVFHAACIKKWLESSPTCPQCRIMVFSSKKIPRIFFSFIDSSSRLCGDAQLTDGLRSSSTQDISSARLEIVRLRGALSSLEAQVKSAERKINEQATEINTISELYRETNELYRLEHQKCLQARTQLAGYSRVVKEAQEMKDECFQLRQKTTELKDIETLVRQNEDAAMELMQKYRNQDDYSPETICSLFRWVAILRAELSEAQNRSRKYRADAHRLRRAHAASTKLVTDLERQLEHYKSRATQMESEMEHLLGGSAHSPSAAESFFTTSTASSCTPTSSTTTTLNTESKLGLKHCLHFIDMPTPEVTPGALKRKVGGAPLEVAKVTPRVNPFKCESTPGVKDYVDANKVSCFNFDPDEEEEQLLPRRTFDRRPSSLFKLAIMRDFNKKFGQNSEILESAPCDTSERPKPANPRPPENLHSCSTRKRPFLT
ncbi:E3 ubiquitin-protein ligase TRAIP [Taenia crassiceps]|uniref:E3 ubiquitin-protein ligase TRAIP n=1 Tax=Taenia crassiceps TaxID=6207 RepID=A0ABR4QPD1_9CEST